MKILKKILAFTTTLALSVSAMAFSMTASALSASPYTYNGKTYDEAYIDESIGDFGSSGELFCFIGTNTANYINYVSGGGPTLDIYGSLLVTSYLIFTGNSPVINVMDGGSLTVSTLNIDNHLTINNYGGTVDIPEGILSQDNITFNVFPKEITPDTEGGKNTNTIGATTTTIPAPTYRVTIPTNVDFGKCEKKLSDADDKIAEKEMEFICYSTNLGKNEKRVNVTLSSTMKITSGEYSLDYTIFDGDNKEYKDGDKMFSLSGADETDNKLYAKHINYTAKLDQSKIKAEGHYTGTAYYIISFVDDEEV